MNDSLADVLAKLVPGIKKSIELFKEKLTEEQAIDCVKQNIEDFHIEEASYIVCENYELDKDEERVCLDCIDAVFNRIRKYVESLEKVASHD